jgi:hypothetical protein
MSTRRAAGAAWILRVALPWLALAAALTLATSPVWGQLLFGFNPTLDELLRLRCLPRD